MTSLEEDPAFSRLPPSAEADLTLELARREVQLTSLLRVARELAASLQKARRAEPHQRRGPDALLQSEAARAAAEARCVERFVAEAPLLLLCRRFSERVLALLSLLLATLRAWTSGAGPAPAPCANPSPLRPPPLQAASQRTPWRAPGSPARELPSPAEAAAAQAARTAALLQDRLHCYAALLPGGDTPLPTFERRPRVSWADDSPRLAATPLASGAAEESPAWLLAWSVPARRAVAAAAPSQAPRSAPPVRASRQTALELRQRYHTAAYSRSFKQSEVATRRHEL